MALGWQLAGVAGALIVVGSALPAVAAEQNGTPERRDADQGNTPSEQVVSSVASEPSRRVSRATRSAPGTQSARQHFLRALSSYRAGDYQRARAELERAAELDSGSKDLQYNLAIVLEKLGQYKAAIRHWERYRALEAVPAERERARLAIERLAAVHARRLREARDASSETAGEGRGVSQGNSGFEGWAVGSAVLSAAALCAGAVLGVRAVTMDPDRDKSVADEAPGEVEKRARRAHSYAIAADLALALGAGAGLAAGLFWFAEPAQTTADWRPVTLGVGWGGRF